MKTEEEYFDLLGMFGAVLSHLGGAIEVPYDELKNLDLTTKEMTTKFDPERNVFIFELKSVVE